MPFTFVNDPETAAPSDQIEPDARDFEIMLAGVGGVAGSGFGQGPTGVETGCAVTAQGVPDQTVAVALGAVRIGGRYVKVAAGSVSLSAADATNPRIDLITVDTTGLKGVTDGTASADPVYPTLPAGKVILAQVFRAANDNTIQTADITDKRVTIAPQPYEDITWYGAVGNDSTNASTAVQAAIDAAYDTSLTTGRTRTVFVPRGSYRLVSTITLREGIAIIGVGYPGVDSRYGSWFATSTTGMTMFEVPNDATLRQNGIEIRNIGFAGSVGHTGVTGLSIYNMNRYRIQNCSFLSADDTAMGTGIFLRLSGGGMDHNWNKVIGCEFRKTIVGIDAYGIVGLSIDGCHFVSSSAQTSGWIGLIGRADASGTTQSVRIIDSEFIVPSNGIGIHWQGVHGKFIGCHCEGVTSSTGNTGYKIEKVGVQSNSGKRNEMIGLSVVKCATGVEIGTGCTQNSVLGIDYITNTTNFSDSGTETAYIPSFTGEIAKLAVGLDWPQVTAPASPATGFHRFYVDTADSIFKSKSSTGVISIYGSRTRSMFLDASILRLDGAAGVRLGAPPNAVDGVQLADAVTSGAYCNFLMPVDVLQAATVTVRPIWVPGSTDAVAHTVRWQMVMKILTNTDVTAAGTTVSWTGDSAARTVNVEVMETGQASTGVTPASNDRMQLEIRRVGADAADTYVGAVNLIGLRIDFVANN